MRRLPALVWIAAALGCAADDPAWAKADMSTPDRTPSSGASDSAPSNDPARDDDDDDDTDRGDDPKPDAGENDPVPEPGFVEVTEQAGLDLPSGGIGVAPFCLLDNAANPNEPGDFCHPERFLGAPAFADLDDDGWPELTLTADFGTGRQLWNDGGRFVDTTWASGVGAERNGMGSTFGDYDRDGDLDLLVVGNEGSPRLFRNDAANGAWLAVRAVGSASNRPGIGARITVSTPGTAPLVRWIRGDSALIGQPAAIAHFGVGDLSGATLQTTPARRCGFDSVSHVHADKRVEGNFASRWIWSGGLDRDELVARNGTPNCHGDEGSGVFADGELVGLTLGPDSFEPDSLCTTGVRVATVRDAETFFDAALQAPSR